MLIDSSNSSFLVPHAGQYMESIEYVSLQFLHNLLIKSPPYKNSFNSFIVISLLSSKSKMNSSSNRTSSEISSS